MHDQLWNASILPDPQHNVQPWINLIKYHPGYWKRLIRRACTHAAQQRCREVYVRELHDRALQLLAQHGELAQPPPARKAKPFNREAFFGCLTCGIRCRTLGGEGAHMFRVHGHVAQHRALCQGTQCLCCLKEYHALGRLANHLRSNAVCRRTLEARHLQLRAQPSHGSGLHHEQELQHNLLRIPVQAEGPKLPAAIGPEEPNYHPEFFVTLPELALAGDLQAFEREVLTASTRYVPSWTRFCATLRWFIASMTDEDLELCPIPAASLRQACDRLTDPGNGPFFSRTSEDTG